MVNDCCFYCNRELAIHTALELVYCVRKLTEVIEK